ncbi:DUF4760 domain-containing protein [Candidatus Electrothrix aarhusensis]
MQSYIALSDRLLSELAFELQDVYLFASLDYPDGKYPNEEDSVETRKRQIKHYLFMQFTMYEQMFCLQELCDRQAMQAWNKRFFYLVKKERMSGYWKDEYMKQSCDEFKKFVNFCLEAKSHEELIKFFNKRKQTFIARYGLLGIARFLPSVMAKK